VIYEVYKKVLRERGEDVAVMIAAQMSSTMVVELTAGLSMLTAGLSIKNSLPMFPWLTRLYTLRQSRLAVRWLQVISIIEIWKTSSSFDSL